jgi:Activator of Hsp90 ATPase homolog 1-like protein
VAYLHTGLGRSGRHGRGHGRGLARRARSTVTFTIEADDKGVVKLTVIHDGFISGSNVLQGISAGWPAVLASLKTMLEIGSPLPW